MKIFENVNVKIINVNELKGGELFLYKNEYYLASKPELQSFTQGVYFAISVETGEVVRDICGSIIVYDKSQISLQPTPENCQVE